MFLSESLVTFQWSPQISAFSLTDSLQGIGALELSLLERPGDNESDSELLKHVTTLMPFIAARAPIPDTVFTLPLINSIASYSHARIQKDLAFQMIELALNFHSGRTVSNCLIWHNRYYYPVEKLLLNTLFERHRFFRTVLSMLNLKYTSYAELPEFERMYILMTPSVSTRQSDSPAQEPQLFLQSLAGASTSHPISVSSLDDIPEFVLFNIRNGFLKKICISLIKFDSPVFSEYLLKLTSIRKEQAFNLFFILLYLKIRVGGVMEHIIELTEK